MSDLITISSSVLPYSARVVGFRGTESMSKPFHFEIYLQMRQEIGEEFDLADAIGAKARLVLDRADVTVPPFTFAGIFANVELLHAYEGHILVRAHLVPRLWQLGLSRHSRLFTKMKVPDIITSVLEENGITDFELRLGSYEVEEHICQYGESDLDFISRWMEREGIFYFFEHSEDGEKLILVDQKLYDDDEVGKPVRYFPQVGHDHSAGPHFRAFTCRQNTLPASVRLKDYDYAKPNLNVTGLAKVASNGAGEVSVYGDRFFTPAAGDHLARTRAEELLARQAVYHGAGTRLHLRPGYTFELEDHPFPSFNTKYLTIEARHSGNQSAGLASFRELMQLEHDDVYLVEIDSIPAKTQFRAESVTAWPRIYGYENGIVDGPAESEYAQIDEQGRYNAKFKFDESALKNGKATTWVRMMQPHGGDIEGFHFPLRKGTEVVFSFLGGDPDRPVISGVVPNAVNPSPVTQANYTKNVIQTGARNRLEIEDKAGNEWIRLSTPYATSFLNMGLAYPTHEVTLSTQDNMGLGAMQALDIGVGDAIPGPSGAGNMTVHVQNNLTTTIDNVDMRTTVSAGNAYLTVTAGTLTETIKGNTKREIQTGNYEIDVDTANMITNVKSDSTTTVQGNTVISTTGKTTITSVGEVHIHSDPHVIIDAVTITQESHADTHSIVHGNTDQTVYGNSEITRHGNTSNKQIGLSNTMFVGATNTMSCAASNSMYFGLKNTMELSAASTVNVGLRLDITAAIKLALSFGAVVDLNFTEVFALAPIKNDIKGTKISEIIADIATTPTHTRMGALVSNLAGLFAVV